ncbi:MAG: HAD family hydrolase [Oscillospiraceae bacterium]|jgi:Cof subfamily protein (haloacid dehalogenase superfamily)|nr:HAD family hydrolase [Oscillospiraceae bacterium]
MQKGKTLYISDLDGTLLNGAAELSETTARALNRMIAEGLWFSVATARTAASAFQILAGVRLSVPLVLMNGVLIYDPAQKQYIQVLPLAAGTVSAVIETLQSQGVTGLMYQLDGSELRTYYEERAHKPIRDFIEERITRFNKKFRQTASFLDVPPEQIIYFTLLDTQDNIKRVHDALEGLSGICRSMYKDIYSPNLWYLEIHSDKASKQNGVSFLREKYGFDRIIGFGDNLNDLPLFAACDHKVAVANAKDEVKAAADVICGTNEDDGVVRWIEERM